MCSGRLADNLGSVRDIVDSDGEVVNHIIYDAFGNITSETDTDIEHAYGYTGRERDEESDLQYNRARYYDASVGRWISEDPIGFAAGDSNLARYGMNSPTNVTDPSGKVGIKDPYQPATIEDRPSVILDPRGRSNKIVIVSGFGRFDDYPTDRDNPSYVLAKQVAVQLTIRGIPTSLSTPVPVSWGEIEKIIPREVSQARKSGLEVIWIALGAGDDDTYRIEVVGDNETR